MKTLPSQPATASIRAEIRVCTERRSARLLSESVVENANHVARNRCTPGRRRGTVGQHDQIATHGPPIQSTTK